MNTDQRNETVINVRLKPDDREALEWAMERVRQQAGAGVHVSAASAVRWALHTCKEALGDEAKEGAA